MKKAIIIIPAYNEEKNIAGVINGIKNVIPDADILVVNDGGEDRTEEIVRELGEQVISLPYNMGYGVALQTGFIYALKKGYEYAVQIDADGQHEPEDIPKLLDEVFNNKADVIIGSRFLAGGNYKASFIRRVGMLFFANLTSLIIGEKITDSTSGYQAINKHGLQFYAGDYYPVDFPDADMIIMLHRAGLKIKEIPVTMYPGVQGKSMHSGLNAKKKQYWPQIYADRFKYKEIKGTAHVDRLKTGPFSLQPKQLQSDYVSSHKKISVMISVNRPAL